MVLTGQTWVRGTTVLEVVAVAAAHVVARNTRTNRTVYLRPLELPQKFNLYQPRSHYTEGEL